MYARGRSTLRPPCRIAGRLDAAEMERLHTLLETQVRPRLRADVSNYAKGRRRAWLERDMPLMRGQPERPGLKVPELWKGLCSVWEHHLPRLGPPETGLAIHGPIGIKVHRDAPYAKPVCMNINFGRALWFHDRDRNGPHDYPVPEERCQQLEGGEVIVFDCKHPHGAIPTDPAGERWTVVLWQCK